MKPLFGWTDQHCKNSKQLAEELKNIQMKPNEKSISHDVISLFMKASVQATIEIVQNQLQEDRTLKKHVKLAIRDVNNCSSLSPHQLTDNSGKTCSGKKKVSQWKIHCLPSCAVLFFLDDITCPPPVVTVVPASIVSLPLQTHDTSTCIHQWFWWNMLCF